MEAATPLRQPRVHVLMGRLIVESLVVDDPARPTSCARRTDAGDDPARVVADAIEIGTRVLDREQTGATVELLRQDLEKASRDVEQRLGQTSEAVVTELRTRLEEAFGPDSGHVTRVLERHFGGGLVVRRAAPGPRRGGRAADRLAREALQAVLLGRGVQPAGQLPEATRWPPSASRRTSSTPTCAR